MPDKIKPDVSLPDKTFVLSLLQPIVTTQPPFILADDFYTPLTLSASNDTSSSQPLANNLPPFNRLIGCGG
ncbi:MAG TPA: hypothetical protein PK239_17710 [Chitinophagales bacterium]|nr:hypothetical protein [Chitinophagales bacterium]HRK29115.1 hypothetical protein [Chitinophagales bacterium]